MIPLSQALHELHEADSWSAIGRLRMRLPVAAKIALHRAGAIGGTPGSPAPPSGTPKSGATRGTRMWRGGGFMRGAWYQLKLVCWTRPSLKVILEGAPVA